MISNERVRRLENISSDENLAQTTTSKLSGPDVRLSILLVNYNGMIYLAKCLESIKHFAPSETEVILVDNASTDGSADFITREYPWVRVIPSVYNLGFSKGNNLAGEEARGRFLLLLNTDTVLLEPIAPAIDWLNEHCEYGALTINMLDSKKLSQACTGRFPSPLRLIVLRAMLIPPQTYGNNYAYEVDWVQGSFLLLRAEQWKALGGLDESYFMYVEDVDLCKRIRNSGLRCAYLPQIRYLHFGGYNPSRFPDQTASLGIYIRHHMKGIQRLVSWGILWIGCLARTVFYSTRMLFRREEISRTASRASWRAFKLLLRKELQ